jgi:hypothetical protein
VCLFGVHADVATRLMSASLIGRLRSSRKPASGTIPRESLATAASCLAGAFSYREPVEALTVGTSAASKTLGALARTRASFTNALEIVEFIRIDF